MRIFRLLLLLGLVVIFSSTSCAHFEGTEGLEYYPTITGESPETCYSEAAKLLDSGKDFDRAIALLRVSVKAAPNNPDYHLALGCAYADRAASVAWAAAGNQLLADYKSKYAKSVSDWEAAQKDPKNADYGLSRPGPPPAYIVTKDDGKPFTLTQDQATTLADQLSKETLAEWEETARLSPPGQKHAYAEYIRGWGILMVAPFLKNASRNTLIDFQENADAAKAFEMAANESPSNIAYWSALGYSGNETQQETAIARSLALDPNNPALLYGRYRYLNDSSFMVEMRKSQIGHWKKTVPADLKPATPHQTQDALWSTANAGPWNAFWQYELAQSIFDSTNYKNNAMNNPDVGTKMITRDQANEAMVKTLTPQDRRLAGEALSVLARGNVARDFAPYVYHPASPGMLRVAWNYGTFHVDMFTGGGFSDIGPLRGLARDACGYADAAVLQNDLPSAEKTDRAVIAMGYKLIGNWPIKNESYASTEFVQVLIGTAIAYLGYEDLLRNEQKYGTPAKAKAIEAEFDSFKARAERNKKASRNYLQSFGALYY